MVAAMVALCAHPSYVAGCGGCGFRSEALAEHLAALVDAALSSLGGES